MNEPAETVPVKYANKLYETWLSYSQIKQLGIDTGVDLLKGTGMEKTGDPEVVITFMTAALQNAEPSITRQFVEDNFRLHQVHYYTDYFARLAGAGDSAGDNPNVGKPKGKGKN